MHDLHLVAIVQPVLGVATARDDLAIDLHRHPALGEVFGLEQCGDGGVGFDVAGFAVELDLHAAIVAGSAPALGAALQLVTVTFS